jgi:hypothetical protein
MIISMSSPCRSKQEKSRIQSVTAPRNRIKKQGELSIACQFPFEVRMPIGPTGRQPIGIVATRRTQDVEKRPWPENICRAAKFRLADRGELRLTRRESRPARSSGPDERLPLRGRV